MRREKERLFAESLNYNWFHNLKNGRYTNRTKEANDTKRKKYGWFREIRSFVSFVYPSCETASRDCRMQFSDCRTQEQPEKTNPLCRNVFRENDFASFAKSVFGSFRRHECGFLAAIWQVLA